jgi:hypothetical protein
MGLLHTEALAELSIGSVFALLGISLVSPSTIELSLFF